MHVMVQWLRRFSIILFICKWIDPIQTGDQDYCTGDVFDVKCEENQVIQVTSAVFGRMELGRCIPEDVGFLGCQNDALSAVDKECSGRQSCEVFVSNKIFRKDVPGACMSALSGYAKIAYQCLDVLFLRREHCTNTPLQLTSESNLLASSTILSTCSAVRHQLRISADRGQRLNISLWSFNSAHHQSYATVRDDVTGNVAEAVPVMRQSHVMTTAANTATLEVNSIQADQNYIIDIEVLGCKEMTPPEGAWMTRDADVIEIGCHTGSKTWSLRCVENRWEGVLGQCGVDDEKVNEVRVIGQEKAASDEMKISLNVIIFGASSVVILISSLMFLAGVLLLKRKIPESKLTATAVDSQTLRLLHENGQLSAMPMTSRDGVMMTGGMTLRDQQLLQQKTCTYNTVNTLRA